MKKIMLLIGLLTGILSCRPHELAPLQLVKWVESESNGLRIVKEIGKIKFDLQYQPVDYRVILQEKKQRIPSNEYEVLKNEKKGVLCFRLRLEAKNSRKGDLIESLSTDYPDYARLVEYLSFNMQNDFKLLIGADTLKCSLYHFERSYQMAPYSTVILGFEQPAGFHNAEDLHLLYQDNLFSLGQVNFVIEAKKIAQVPKLKLS